MNAKRVSYMTTIRVASDQQVNVLLTGIKNATKDIKYDMKYDMI